MKNCWMAVLLVLLGTAVYGQKTTFSSAQDSDPAAKALLDKVRQKYTAYKSLTAEFTVDMEFPDTPKETQKGKMHKEGAKYRVSVSGQEVICDGSTIWMIFPQNKEVQISNIPDEDEMGDNILTPDALLSFYDKGQFAYTITNEYKDATGRQIQEIEFKPLDKNADYSKLRMAVVKSTAEVVSVKAFGKDGSKYTLTMTKLLPDRTFETGFFVFNKAQYPGYYIEDLRD
ncbi:MAG TPA: outer membrane lipoprotein carrier protein LolA [Saprospiraceae bacterium]|nr:outer membrane lipoprotein carrier protein LolA [Saprospiraceae bacterium]HMQ83131.1 outer membrane lipoprotein carrier protein LolA [Saprospiraceae bacterium]